MGRRSRYCTISVLEEVPELSLDFGLNTCLLRRLNVESFVDSDFLALLEPIGNAVQILDGIDTERQMSTNTSFTFNRPDARLTV